MTDDAAPEKKLPEKWGKEFRLYPLTSKLSHIGKIPLIKLLLAARLIFLLLL